MPQDEVEAARERYRDLVAERERHLAAWAALPVGDGGRDAAMDRWLAAKVAIDIHLRWFAARYLGG